MKRKNIIIFCFISAFLFLMLPHIPALQYTKTKEEITRSLTETIINDNKKINTVTDKKGEQNDIIKEVTPLLSKIAKYISNIQSTLSLSSLLGFIINLILSIIVIILNLLITVISIVSGLVSFIFGTAINILVGLIKKILNLSTILEKILDVVASILINVFSIYLNIIVGVLTIIKDIIVNIISPDQVTC